MTMKGWSEKLSVFLQFNEKEILTNAGKVFTEIAKAFAEDEFEKYHVIQDQNFESDFDREVKRVMKRKGLESVDKDE